MGHCVGDRAERGGSPVVVVNVLLLAVLMAVLALGISNGTASAHDGRVSSVESLQLRVASTSIEYTDARDASINRWSAAAIPVNVFKSSNPTVVFYQDNNSRGDNAVGMYTWYSGSFDQIFFFKSNIVKFNFGTYDKRWVGVHELGHALRLNHSDSNQTCFTSVMCSSRTSGAGQPWTEQSHDVNDVKAYF